jgi:hypothetical protein
MAFLLAIFLCQAIQSSQPTLFERLAGRWVLTGTLDKQQTTHDVDADVVLNAGYVRLHEVSRDKDAQGRPAYEAIIFISVDKNTGEYRCLWLDTTSNAGLSGEGIGRAAPSGNSIPFVFKTPGGGVFNNTFTYVPASDTWQWKLDDATGGKLEPFGRVTLTRRR